MSEEPEGNESVAQDGPEPVPSLSAGDIFAIAGAFGAALWVFGATERLPPDYYQKLRWFVFVIAACLSCHAFPRLQPFAWLFAAVAVLYNPFFQIGQLESAWITLNGVVGMLFLMYLAAVPDARAPWSVVVTSACLGGVSLGGLAGGAGSETAGTIASGSLLVGILAFLVQSNLEP